MLKIYRVVNVRALNKVVYVKTISAKTIHRIAPFIPMSAIVRISSNSLLYSYLEDRKFNNVMSLDGFKLYIEPFKRLNNENSCSSSH